jgi:hypothetical protein
MRPLLRLNVQWPSYGPAKPLQGSRARVSTSHNLRHSNGITRTRGAGRPHDPNPCGDSPLACPPSQSHRWRRSSFPCRGCPRDVANRRSKHGRDIAAALAKRKAQGKPVGRSRGDPAIQLATKTKSNGNRAASSEAMFLLYASTASGSAARPASAGIQSTWLPFMANRATVKIVASSR